MTSWRLVFLIGFCAVLAGARDAFIKTTVAQQDVASKESVSLWTGSSTDDGGYDGGYGGGYDDDGGSYEGSSTSSYSNVFQQIGQAFQNAAAGFVLFLLGFPVLWFNEVRQVHMFKLFGRAASIALTNLDPRKIDSNNNLNLVHMSGTSSNKDDVTDPVFKLKVKNSASLSRNVEMYLWVETERTEEKNDNFGGKTKVTTYSYSKQWCGHYVDSNRFNDKRYWNPKAPNIGLGNSITYASEVKLGEFTLPQDMVKRLTVGRDCTSEAKKQGVMSGSIGSLRWSEQGQYICSWDLQQDGVGEIRCSFYQVPCGETTVLAVQNQHTFAPMGFTDQVSGGKVQISMAAQRVGASSE